jgi:DNA-binding XRE family transcriptional regulator
MQLCTLGDHLRKTRLDRNLSQPKVAKILNVSDETILSWEKNKTKPSPKDASKIIQFLGYFPFKWEHECLFTNVNYARMIAGHTLKEMANEIGCDPTTLSKHRLSNMLSKGETIEKIEKYLRNNLALNLFPSIQSS